MDEFPLTRIHSGHLICVEDKANGRKFNMVVIPGQNFGCLCCTNGTDYCPLSLFSGPGLVSVSNEWQINAVYGFASISAILDCDNPTGRPLLWRRNVPRPMTRADIERALGYRVRISGHDPEPQTFRVADIHEGMVVERRDGSKRLVVRTQEGLYLVHPGFPADPRLTQPVADYALLPGGQGPQLTRVLAGASCGDLVRVWSRVQSGVNAGYVPTTNTTVRRLLWELPEGKPMSKDDIEKALGYPVELLPDDPNPTTK